MEEYDSYNNGNLLKHRYSKITDLSEGSYGLVTLAKDSKLDNRLVAIKYIYPLDYKKKKETRPSSSPAKLRNNNGNKENTKKQNTKEILKSLYEEAAKEISVHQILGEHPNIAILYDHFDSYLILEYCSRGDLYEAIQNGQGPSLPSDIKDVFKQILDAIEYCHSNNVYHRDLKPENILISDDWSIKLCDWGLATTTRHVTNKSEFDIGSERYMAPELFDTELVSYDAAKIDLWSIGIILLTLIFHKNPFEVANYSDKRFVQFAANRESLFDIFSTMTGDLFSVLRYCLNLDPANRDLESVKTELKGLNYFTIDDEFCSSDLDDYYSDEDQYDEEHLTSNEETGVVDHYVDARFVKDPKKVPGITTQEILSDDISPDDDDDEGESTFYMEDSMEANKSSSTLNKNDFDHKEGINVLPSPTVTKDDHYDMPYNERAEALLSNSTNLKPIPIGLDGFNSNVRGKFFRQTRKPISVASYQSASFQHKGHNKYNNNNHGNNYGYHSNKFNREDFFTPKSVFNHYMNKYGESRDLKTNQDRPKLNKRPSNWKRNNNKPKSWKKNYRNSYKNNKKNNNSYNTANSNYSGGLSHSFNQNYNYNHYKNKNEFFNYNTPVQHRRKSNSFSSSKPRSVIASSLNNQLSGSYLNSGNSVQNLNTMNSYGSSTGKYVPPSMRSPNYAKSPLIHASNETIEHLSLSSGNDYGVFDLEEDDLDLKTDRDKKKYKIPTYHIPTERNDINETNRFNDFSSTSTLSSASNTISNNAHGSISSYESKAFEFNERGTGSGGSGTSSNGDRTGRERPISMTGVNDVSAVLASNSNGKYIPPFRRRSQSNGPGNGHIKDKEKEKRRSKIEVMNIADSFNKINLNGHEFSSIPNPTVDWYSKHEWSD